MELTKAICALIHALYASKIMKFSLSPRLAPIIWIFYWLKCAEHDATRRDAARYDATRRSAGDLQHHVGNCIRLRRNGKERIYRNKLPPRSHDWISVTERRIFRARTAKIIDDVSRGCLMDARTRAPRFHARKETESNSSERAREPRWYVLRNIRGAAHTSSSCQFHNIALITDVTRELCNSDYSSDLFSGMETVRSFKIIRVDTIPYVRVCSTSPGNGKAPYFERQILDPLGNTEHSPEDTNRGCLIRSSWRAKPERWSSSGGGWNTVEFGIRPITLLFIV